MKNLYMLLAVAAGAGVAAQALINARLRFVLGAPVWAAMTQFIVGLTILGVVALVTRQAAPQTAGLERQPWWIWTGGFYGALFIMMSVIVTPRLGAAVMLASAIVGQLAAALVFDHYGFFGGTEIPLTVTRILGAALLALGVVLLRLP